MKILAVDTSANVASAAICEEDRLICENILNHKKTHSEKIMPMIDELLQDSETKINEIDLFTVANGPGSFTGLRIGVSTVKALAHAVQKPVVGISTLEGMAYNLFDVEGLIAPIMDARRSQVYNALYRWEKGILTEVIPPRAIALSDCLTELSGEKKIYFLGDGVPVYEKEITSVLGSKAVFAPMTAALQRASSIAALALVKAKSGNVENYQTLMPFYLRKPQAEREYEQKNREDR